MSEKQQLSGKIQIRRYLQRDFDVVKTLTQGLARVYNEEFSDYIFNGLMQARMLDASTSTFVVEYDGKVCGCAFADTERDPRCVLYGRISNVNIVEKYRRKGMGSALVDKAVNFLSGLSLSRILANVNPKDEETIQIFQKREFKPLLKVMEKRIFPPTLTPRMESKQGDIVYRTVAEKDLPEVKEFNKQLAMIFHDDFDPYWFDLCVQKYFQDPASRIFVAEQGGKVLGVAFGEVRRDPGGYSYGYISNIMVDSSVRRKRIGRNLLQMTSFFLENLNVPKIWANVRYDNAEMQHFFERQGFTPMFTVMAKKTTIDGAC
ncbi:MAG: hypothetical protein RBG13Loki_1486 [Promethearchaeota archaeon CR_4]|nr:MAG: hypothetical protein RBG13Loki_1486 [Candidatus Lokiarchaeota archaeon CR_4]